ncbi:MAG: tetratricopeptide repeat protein [Flavobacterium sp.]
MKSELVEWQEKLDFYKMHEAQIADLEQKYVARKKIQEAEAKINELQTKILPLEDKSVFYGDKNDITTLHQALDLLLQQRDGLNHKTSKEEFEDIEKIKNDFFEKVFGEYKEKITAIPLLKNRAVINLFERILTSEKLGTSLINEITDIRKDFQNYNFYDRSVVISSLTLSVLSWNVFDYKKIDLLIDFLTDFEDREVWNKALTGIIISTIIHQNRLQRFPQLVKRLETLQQLEKVQIGIYLIDTILRNQLFESVMFPHELEKDDFLNETPYNWFYPFYKDNEIISDAIEHTAQDIDIEEFLEHIYNLPLIGAYKYAICKGLKENKIKVIRKGDKDFDESNWDKLGIAYYFYPYFNLVSELYLYYKYFPKDRVQSLFSSKITLADTKLKNIILSKTQALKLAAELHYEKGEYGSCIQKNKDLLNIEPNQLSALIQIALCYIKKKEYADALTYLLQIEKITPEDVSNLYDIGFCLSNLKQYKKSNEYLLKANSIHANNELILTLIGQNYKDLHQYNDCITFTLEVLKIDENSEAALYNLSIAYSKTEQFQKALDCTMKLHRMYPKDTEYLIALAEDYADLENFDEAIKLAEKAFLTDSEEPNIVFGYARILFVTLSFEKSKLTLNKVLGLKNSKDYYGITYGNLGHIFLFEKNLEMANNYYEKCVLEFDDIADFQDKFNTDLKYALAQGISKADYELLRDNLVRYWQENN